MDTIGVLTSLALQYGVPIDALVRKFEHVRFEPSGFTRNPEIPMDKSIVDYIFRWLGMNFVPGYREANAPSLEQPGTEELRSPTQLPPRDAEPQQAAEPHSEGLSSWLAGLQSDAPPCDECGAITVRNGNCFKCLNCGNSLGCS